MHAGLLMKDAVIYTTTDSSIADASRRAGVDIRSSSMPSRLAMCSVRLLEGY